MISTRTMLSSTRVELGQQRQHLGDERRALLLRAGLRESRSRLRATAALRRRSCRSTITVAGSSSSNASAHLHGLDVELAHDALEDRVRTLRHAASAAEAGSTTRCGRSASSEHRLSAAQGERAELRDRDAHDVAGRDRDGIGQRAGHRPRCRPESIRRVRQACWRATRVRPPDRPGSPRPPRSKRPHRSSRTRRRACADRDPWPVRGTSRSCAAPPTCCRRSRR